MRLLFSASVLATSLALAACQPKAETAPAPETPAPAAVDTAAAPSAAPAAGDDHAHGSPNGGTVKTAGGGHLELVTEHTGFKIYVLDGSEKMLPVESIAGAEAIVQPDGGGEPTTVPLTVMGDHLHGVLPEGTFAYTAIVSVPVAGETRTAQFTVGLDSHATHAH